MTLTNHRAFLLVFSCLLVPGIEAWAGVPTFPFTAGDQSYVLAGKTPNQGGTTTIPTVLVPLSLSIEGTPTNGKPTLMDASADAAAVLASPVFSKFAFAGGAPTQYGDALLRATFANAPADWHTLLGKPEIRPLRIAVPAGYGYVLRSKKSGRKMAVADLDFVRKQVLEKIGKEDGKLILIVTHNTTFYADGDATICCSWGTHGTDPATGNAFVLSTVLRDAPAVVTDQDMQPLTQQLADFLNDPRHDPGLYGRNAKSPGNNVPAWLLPTAKADAGFGACGGGQMSTAYFLLQPTNTNPKNNFPASPAFAAGKWHLQNVALLRWYLGPKDGLGVTNSFPDAGALKEPAKPCPTRGPRGAGGPRPSAPSKPTTEPVALTGTPNGHKLIGYWAGYGGPGSTFPLREISPQWDVIIVAFAVPDKNAPEGTMVFRTPGGLDKEQFKADIAWLKSQGKKVLLSFGGGGQHFTLADPKRVPNFVASTIEIVSDYGFDGIDIDFESPSLSIAPGDVDFRHPTTPSIVNLIDALKQVRAHFGPQFLLTLVPEGTQIPSGYPSYGGQFGSYLPIAHALRDMLYFMDVQDYNTPPLQGLDGEIYQPGTVDYHAAMTELVLAGFPVGGNPKYMFPPLPASKVAVGFLNGDTTPAIVQQAMDYIITGKAPAGVTYKLRKASGYPEMTGAMFWTIDADRRGNYNYSNVVGPQLHSYKPTK